MKVNLMNYAMPLKSQNVRFCSNQVDSIQHESNDYFPDVIRSSSSYAPIVERERAQIGLNSLPPDRTIAIRNFFAWDLALKETPTPACVAAKLLKLAPSEVKAFDVTSTLLTQPSQIQPSVVIKSWTAITSRGASLIVEAFRGLLGGKSTKYILAAIEEKAAGFRTV